VDIAVLTILFAQTSGHSPKNEKELLLKIKAYLLAYQRIESGFCVYE